MTQTPPHRVNLFRKLLPFLVVALLPFASLTAQTKDPRVVQISGRVVTEENEKLVFLPYAVIAVQGTSRGTLSDGSGFFSIVVRTDETLVFSVLGYKDAFFPVPDTLTNDRYTMFQILTRDTFVLPAAVIYPWPDPDNFVHEFLAMDVHDDLEDIAAENMSAENLDMLRQNLPTDGPEHT